MLTVLGPCSQIVSASPLVIDEATTVAAVYALAQFLSPGAGANLAASATNSIGLSNAVATAMALVDITEGTFPGPAFAANASSPAARIDSLANLLNACVASSAACAALFSATTTASSAAPPGNTIDALLNLARNPAVNVAQLFTLSRASFAYTPTLAAAPSDWTLFVNYTGGGMDQPTGLGVDASGNVWVASYFGVTSLFSTQGKPLLSPAVTGLGLGSSYGLAVDATGNAWVPNEPGTAPGNSVSVIDATGNSVAGSAGFTAGGLDFPVAIAIDTDTTAWVVDYGDSHLTHLSSSGQPLSGTSGYTSPLLALPVAAALDSSHNLWVANQAGSSVTKVAPDGSQFTGYPCGSGPSGIAIDRLGNAWVANFYDSSVSRISSPATASSNTAYIGGGIDQPQGIAVDGAGDIWIANFRGPSISKLAGDSHPDTTPGTPLSPATGLASDAALSEAYALAIDASGNLWVTSSGSSVLTQLIGLAAPVRTPLLGPPVAP